MIEKMVLVGVSVSAVFAAAYLAWGFAKGKIAAYAQMKSIATSNTTAQAASLPASTASNSNMPTVAMARSEAFEAINLLMATFLSEGNRAGYEAARKAGLSLFECKELATESMSSEAKVE